MRLGLTGSTGFIGGEIHRQAIALGWHVVALVRPGSTAEPTDRCTTRVVGDLTSPASIRGMFADVDAVLHCANAIDGAPDWLTAVNIAGTHTVLAECSSSQRVRSIGVVSTTSVYRNGQHHLLSEREAVEGPSSARSHTRLAADRLVRSHGGFALRPHFVVGPGDTRVLPTAARFLTALNSDAPQSFIDVRDLASLALHLSERRLGTGRVFHATGRCSLGWPTALRAVGLSEIDSSTSRAAPTRRQLELLNTEHTYDDSAVRNLTRLAPLHDPSTPDDDYIRWYASCLDIPGVRRGSNTDV